MQTIKKQKFPYERDLYNIKDTKLVDCEFKGVEDGESALKECHNIELENCLMDLRYPLWHDHVVKLNNVTQTENCRASLWYSTDITINNSTLNGIKAVRESHNIVIFNSKINSSEFGWKSSNFTINDTFINSEYIFFLSEIINASNSSFEGKYGFQYIKDSTFVNCNFKTKDAFWHGKNIVVRDSYVEGEYLGWYSENLTFINCKIKGIQPLCYCKGLKLINCEMEDANLAFEYSDVNATINGYIESVKNPLSGVVEADAIGEILYTDDVVKECNGIVKIRDNKHM